MIKFIQYSSNYLLALITLALLSACGSGTSSDANKIDDGSDQFVEATLLDDIPASVVLEYIKGGIDANATNAFGYKAVKITYNTVGQNNEPLLASGLLVIPKPTAEYENYRESIGESRFSVSMLCDSHGTIFTDLEAPTNVEKANNNTPDYSIALLTTGYAGFAGIFPDYIGYGESNTISHPYMLKKSSVRSSVDMIKASIKYMKESGIVLNDELYISGYSQGGYNAMALAQSIEEGTLTNVRLKGAAPMAGPHDLEALSNIEINVSRTMIYPAFIGFFIDSYAYYNDDLALSDIVIETNTTKFHNLFDGSYTNVQIHANLGLTSNAGFNSYKTDALLKPAFINDYENNVNSLIRQKFIQNKSYSNWTPKTEVNIIHCKDDEIIPFAIAQNAFNELSATGANISLTPIPSSLIPAWSASDPFVHARCGNTAYATAVKWFLSIKKGDI